MTNTETIGKAARVRNRARTVASETGRFQESREPMPNAPTAWPQPKT